MAGLTSAAVVIPKAMAYATVAGLPLQVGLYTAFVPMAIYALLGTSRPLSVSSTTTLAILSAAALGPVASEGGTVSLLTAGATLALLVGAMLFLASMLRLGFVANFISEPVLIGFKAGIGLVIVVDQCPKLLGVHIHKEGFLRDLLSIVELLPQTSVTTLALAAASVRDDLRPGAFHSQGTGSADRHCGGDRCGEFAGSSGRRCRDRRSRAQRVAAVDLAAARLCCKRCGQRPPALP